MAVRVVAQDGSATGRDELRRALRGDGVTVVGPASDGAEALDLAIRLRPGRRGARPRRA
ncbi:MAG: hypothetical protein QOE11_3507 [Solirubrobacteraceae bacterium]|jgi:chemotaxis response regulator CheB|nr:hypothetical protein [Solirubrobacteraceae bacterium]